MGYKYVKRYLRDGILPIRSREIILMGFIFMHDSGGSASARLQKDDMLRAQKAAASIRNGFCFVACCSFVNSFRE